MKISSFSASSELKNLVIMLHGWGASGDNLISLGREMGKFLPHSLFIAPNAPDYCVQAGGGYQWFSLMDRSDDKMLAGILQAERVINKFIDEQLHKFNFDDSKLVLVGFSQGAMLAVHTALCRKNSCAGVISYSGAVIAGQVLETTNMKSKPPVCLVHGTDDQVVPFSAFEDAEKFFNKNSVPFEAHKLKSLGHSIDERCLRAGVSFIKKHLHS